MNEISSYNNHSTLSNLISTESCKNIISSRKKVVVFSTQLSFLQLKISPYLIYCHFECHQKSCNVCTPISYPPPIHRNGRGSNFHCQSIFPGRSHLSLTNQQAEVEKYDERRKIRIECKELSTKESLTYFRLDFEDVCSLPQRSSHTQLHDFSL